MSRRGKETLKLTGYIASSLIVLTVIAYEGVYVQPNYPINSVEDERSFTLSEHVDKNTDHTRRRIYLNIDFKGVISYLNKRSLH